jgi:alkyl hydroperoxide reductase subunit AhpC
MSFATLVGKPVPNFTAPSQIGDIDLHSYISNSWSIVFTMPTNFNPVHSSVCTQYTYAACDPSR